MSTRIYSYGAKPPSLRQPEVLNQILFAHRYQNQLVEIEKNRRLQSQTYENTILDPSLLLREEELDQAIKSATAEIKKVRKQTQSRAKMDPSVAAQVEVWKAELKTLRKQIREKRAQIRSDKSGTIKIINDEASEKIREARSECGAFWGSYLLAERAHKAACKETNLNFHRFDGSGQVGVQLQGHIEGQERAGLPVSMLENGTDSRLQTLTMDKSQWQPSAGSINTGNRPLPNPENWRLLRIRIGSNGMQPIWAEIPFRPHRSLPVDGIITWATVQRRRCGSTFTWHVQFTVWTPDEFITHPNSITAGIDVNWRQLPDKTLRVATVSTGDNIEELVLDERILYQLKKPEELRSGRDKDFNRIRESLQVWLKSVESKPDWMVEEFEYLGQWKSPRRLALAVVKWRDLRIEGDEAIYTALNEWRKQDRHLLEFECHLRQRGRNSRLDLYRNWVLSICQRYGILVLEKMDLRPMVKLPKLETLEEPLPKKTRNNRNFAAISELRQCLKEAAAKTGTEIRLSLPRDTTQQCSECGYLNREGPLSAVSNQPTGQLLSRVDPIPIKVKCENCGAVMDQDLRAAKNLLARAEDLPKTLDALANEEG